MAKVITKTLHGGNEFLFGSDAKYIKFDDNTNVKNQIDNLKKQAIETEQNIQDFKSYVDSELDSIDSSFQQVNTFIGATNANLQTIATALNEVSAQGGSRPDIYGKDTTLWGMVEELDSDTKSLNDRVASLENVSIITDLNDIDTDDSTIQLVEANIIKELSDKIGDPVDNLDNVISSEDTNLITAGAVKALSNQFDNIIDYQNSDYPIANAINALMDAKNGALLKSGGSMVGNINLETEGESYQTTDGTETVERVKASTYSQIVGSPFLHTDVAEDDVNTSEMSGFYDSAMIQAKKNPNVDTITPILATKGANEDTWGIGVDGESLFNFYHIKDNNFNKVSLAPEATDFILTASLLSDKPLREINVAGSGPVDAYAPLIIAINGTGRKTYWVDKIYNHNPKSYTIVLFVGGSAPATGYYIETIPEYILALDRNAGRYRTVNFQTAYGQERFKVYINTGTSATKFTIEKDTNAERDLYLYIFPNYL